MSIQRLQDIVAEKVRELFSDHLELIGIPHKKGDLPPLTFEPVDAESPLHKMQRAKLGVESGVITVNEARELNELQPLPEGNELKPAKKSGPNPEMPRENEVQNDVKP